MNFTISQLFSYIFCSKLDDVINFGLILNPIIGIQLQQLIANTPFSDSHACPNDEDMKFLSEQLWLGGSKDAALRFASLLNTTCGGRVSEGFYLFKTSLFPLYTHEIGWNSMALRWLREKNHMMSCLLLVPHAYLYV